MKDLDILVERALAKNVLGALMIGSSKLKNDNYKEKPAIERAVGNNSIRFSKPIKNKEAENFLKLLVYAAYNNIKTSNKRLNEIFKYIKTRFVKVNASVGDLGELSTYNNKLDGACYRYVEKTNDYTTGEGLAFEVLCYMCIPNTIFASKDDPTVDLIEGSGGIQCKWTSSGKWNERFGGLFKKDYGKYKPFKLASGNFSSSKIYTLSEKGTEYLDEIVNKFNSEWSKSKTKINGKTKYESLSGGKADFSKYNGTLRVDGDGELIVNQAFVNSKELISKAEDITTKINTALKDLKEQLTEAIKKELKSPSDFDKLFNNMSSETGSTKQEYELTNYKKKEEKPVDNTTDLNTFRNYNGSLLNKKGSELDKENLIRKAMIKPEINIKNGDKIESVSTVDFGNTPVKRMAHTIQEFIELIIKKYNIVSFGKGTGEIKIGDVVRALNNSSVKTYFNY